MTLRTLLLTIFVLLIGCSTTSKKSVVANGELPAPQIAIPDNKDTESVIIYLENLEKRSVARDIKLWTLYQLATFKKEQDAKESCRLYEFLSQIEDFPLRDVAYLHSLQLCEGTLDYDQVMARLENLSSLPWLKDLTMEVKLKVAEESKNSQLIVSAYLEKSKLPIVHTLKLEYAQKALKVALKNKMDDQVKELQERIYKLAPRYIPNPKKYQYMKIANDFRKNRQFSKARKYYRKIDNDRKNSFALKLLALQGIARSFKLQGDKKNHLNYIKAVADRAYTKFKRYPKNKYYTQLLSDTHIKLARVYWTQGQIKNAKKTLYGLSQNLKGKSTRAKVFWIYGRMAEERQHFDKANWWFKQALLEEPLNQEFTEVIEWYQAWNLRKLKKYPESSEILKKLIAASDNPFNRPKYQFWLAKNLEIQNEFDESRKTFHYLMDEDPMGFYGLLAHREAQEFLQVRNDREPASSEGHIDLEGLKKIANLNFVDWLISVNENDVARLYLDHVADNFRKQQDISSDDRVWVALLNYYAKAGHYLSLFAQLGKIDYERRNHILVKYPHLIFPKPFTETVNESALRFGISPEYIYSIMRQESAFNPRARSHMDAFGLMQLLPKVAKKSAQLNGIPFNKPEDLYKPHISIPLGAAYLRELWDKYDGKIILSTASYNANEKAIQGWLKTRYRGDTLEFIEDIPYEETRNYIKLVLRNFVFYKIFNSEDKRIAFPEWALNLEG